MTFAFDRQYASMLDSVQSFMLARGTKIVARGGDTIGRNQELFIKPRRKTLRFSDRDIRRVPFKVAWEVG